MGRKNFVLATRFLGNSGPILTELPLRHLQQLVPQISGIKCLLFFIDLRFGDVSTTAMLPDRSNIVLRFIEKHLTEMKDALKWYLEMLATSREACGKAVIYCRNLKQTGLGFGMLSYTLHKAYNVPKEIVRELIGEYHAELYENYRIHIAGEFRKPDSRIRCMISTVAFGMGIDIPDIKYVIHWGESNTIPQFRQEIGRGGRDGAPAEAILYHRGNQVSLCEKPIQEMVKAFQNEQCIRQVILSHLTLPEMPNKEIQRGSCVATCCSVCAGKCSCDVCQNYDKPIDSLMEATADIKLK